MRIPFLSKQSFALVLTALFCAAAAAQSPSADDAAKLLPNQLGDFRAQSAPATPPKPKPGESFPLEHYGVRSDARRVYATADGKTFTVYLARTDSEAAAYSLFTRTVGTDAARAVRLGEVGTVNASGPKDVAFVKGRAYVTLAGPEQGPADPQALSELARQFAATLEGGENGLPVLVSHLPDWEKAYVRASYAVTLPALQAAANHRPVLDAVTFEGGAEAVTAPYDKARLVVVEFTTPQHAFDADAAISQRVAELKAAGQPVPSAYKRVGNYSIFVFDAPDAGAAEKLISGVKWEKDVRWLGHNPHAEEIAMRAYTSTMGGVILSTLITSGVAILACLGVGGIIGGAVFLHRRARQSAAEVYTDAGGMVRLNIEDLNTPPPSAKLLKPAED